MDEVATRFYTADDAYRAIHRQVGYAVELSLDDCNYTEAMEYAALMLEIEGLMNGR